MNKTIKIINIIKTPNAILHKFGLEVFFKLKTLLKNEQKIILSFDGLKNVTSGFCNASIGNVYLEFENANEFLTIENINPIWQKKIQDAIDIDIEQIKLQE